MEKDIEDTKESALFEVAQSIDAALQSKHGQSKTALSKTALSKTVRSKTDQVKIDLKQQAKLAAAYRQQMLAEKATDKPLLGDSQFKLSHALSQMIEQGLDPNCDVQSKKRKGNANSSRNPAAKKRVCKMQNSEESAVVISEADGYRDLEQSTMLDLKSLQALSNLKQKLLENQPWSTVFVDQELSEQEKIYAEQKRLASLFNRHDHELFFQSPLVQLSQVPWAQASEMPTLDQVLFHPLACTMLQSMTEMYFKLLQLNNKLMCVSFRIDRHQALYRVKNEVRALARFLKLFDIKQRYPLFIDNDSLPKNLDQLSLNSVVVSSMSGDSSDSGDDSNNGGSSDNTGGSAAGRGANAQPRPRNSINDWDKQAGLSIQAKAALGAGAGDFEGEQDLAQSWAQFWQQDSQQDVGQKLGLSSAEKMQLDLLWNSIVRDLQQCTGAKRQQVFERYAAQWAEHLALSNEISADFVLANFTDCNLVYISQEQDEQYPEEMVVKLYFTLQSQQLQRQSLDRSCQEQLDLTQYEQASRFVEGEHACPLQISPNLLRKQPETFALSSIRCMMDLPAKRMHLKYSSGLPQQFPQTQSECEQVLQHYQWHNLWGLPPMQRLQIHQSYQGNINLPLAKSVHQLLTEVGTGLLCQGDSWDLDVAPNSMFPSFEVFLYALNALEHQQAMFMICSNCRASQLVFSEHLLEKGGQIDLRCRQCGYTLQRYLEPPQVQRREDHAAEPTWQPSLG